MSMSQVPPVRKVHAENLIAILNSRQVDRHICLRATMRLYVRMISRKEFFGAIDCCLLNYVTPLAAAVVAFLWIALGILIRKNGAHSLEHCFADEVFRSNKFQTIRLSGHFVVNGL